MSSVDEALSLRSLAASVCRLFYQGMRELFSTAIGGV